MSDALKITALICATAVTILKIAKDGDGIAVTALFGLIGTLVGVKIGEKKEA